MDYYKILGVDKTASQDDIKKAYRKLASQHHPDKGGDTGTFQKIQEAYDILGDVDKRQAHDRPQFNGDFFSRGQRSQDFDFHNHFHFFSDLFNQHQQRQNQPKNKNINITVNITLEDALNGKVVEGKLTYANSEQTVNITIVAGIEDGSTLCYSGLGGDTVPNAPRGDLLVRVNVIPHSVFERMGSSLRATLKIPLVTAMIGGTVDFIGLDGKKLTVHVPAGTQSGYPFTFQGEGMTIMQGAGRRGDLFIVSHVVIPKVTNSAEVFAIQSIASTLNAAD